MSMFDRNVKIQFNHAKYQRLAKPSNNLYNLDSVNRFIVPFTAVFFTRVMFFLFGYIGMKNLMNFDVFVFFLFYI